MSLKASIVIQSHTDRKDLKTKLETENKQNLIIASEKFHKKNLLEFAANNFDDSIFMFFESQHWQRLTGSSK